MSEDKDMVILFNLSMMTIVGYIIYTALVVYCTLEGWHWQVVLLMILFILWLIYVFYVIKDIIKGLQERNRE